MGIVVASLVFASLKAFAWRKDHREFVQPGDRRQAASTPAGPWGVLERDKIRLEKSSQIFADAGLRLEPPRWVFAGYSRQQLADLLQSAQLTPAQAAFLNDTSHWETLTNGFAISPPDDLILGLSPASRARIYWSLGTNSANYPQFAPFNCLSAGIETRFAESGLEPGKIELIRKLSYPGFGCLWLAVDRPLLQSFNTNELQSLLRVLYSYPAWLLRVQINSNSDIDGLVRYWGEGRENKLRPLLESLAESTPGRSIGVGALLPPFAQARLYTFPDSEAEPFIENEDCFYTAMNFFNDPPDPRFADVSYTRKTLQNNYTAVQPPCKFGDVVVLMDSRGNGIHACVYLADDFVFTKNGGGFEQPWSIMKLSDVAASYPSQEPQRLVLWRRKGT